jgi:hypothetical protein
MCFDNMAGWVVMSIKKSGSTWQQCCPLHCMIGATPPSAVVNHDNVAPVGNADAPQDVSEELELSLLKKWISHKQQFYSSATNV